MKTTNLSTRLFTVIAILAIAFSVFAVNKPKTVCTKEELQGTISISGAFALYPLEVRWGEEFTRIHPGVHFDISAGGAGKGITDALGGMVDLGAVSRDLYPQETAKGVLAFAVARDAVVPTVNSANPNIKSIQTRGLSKAAFLSIYSEHPVANWMDLGFPVSAPVHVYTRSDASGGGETWATYLGLKQEDLAGIGIYGDPGLLQAVIRDPFATGYNNIAYAFDASTKKPFAGITILPIDLNGNGKIDADENFYDSLDAFTKAVEEGKYPSPPARNLYFVSKGKPQRKELVEFLRWVFTEGQHDVQESGYIAVPDEKRTYELNKLKPDA